MIWLQTGKYPFRKNELSSFWSSYGPWITWWPPFEGSNFSQHGWGPEFELGCHLMKDWVTQCLWVMSGSWWVSLSLAYSTPCSVSLFLLHRSLRYSNFGKLILTECSEGIQHVFNTFSFRLSSQSFFAGWWSHPFFDPVSPGYDQAGKPSPQHHPEAPPVERYQKVSCHIMLQRELQWNSWSYITNIASTSSLE